MDREKLIKYVAFVGMAMIAVAALIVLINTLRLSPECNIQTTRPVIDKSKLNNTDSDDFKAIATLGGYLEYESPTGFMPLELGLVKLTNLVSPTEHLLTLSTDCAQLDFFLRDVNHDMGQICRDVVSINIKLIKPHEQYAECFINSPPISSLVRKHFYDPTPRKFTCLSKIGDSPVVSLVTEHLEFEIDGDDAKLKKKEYSKDGQSSCYF